MSRRRVGALCLLSLLGALALIAAAGAETVQKRNVRVAFAGAFSPQALPRQGTAPIAVSVGGRISTTDGEAPPQLRRITLAINRSGRLDAAGLPVCRLREIQPSTNEGALRACGRSLVGTGSFSANVELPQQAPFPAQGKILAFAGREGGKPAILAHVYRSAAGDFGTVLTTSLPQVTSDWGFVTGLTLRLNRRFTYRGERRSYLSAGCPAPRGFSGASFPLARASFVFARGMTLTTVLNRACRVRGR
jgi:hypothetical protein